MNPLTLALIQTELIWEDSTANRAHLEEKINQISEKVDLIMLPEMFTTGFTMNAKENAEVKGTTTHKWMQQMAKQHSCAIVGSYITREGSLFFNTLTWVDESGMENFYRKKHLFRMADEHKHFHAGIERIIIDYKGWKICPLICYDLRFPEWSRNKFSKKTNALDYDLLLYVANWPATRAIAWTSLLQARAVENLCYTAGVNRIGVDGNDVEYSGNSAVFDFKGNQMIRGENDEILISKISKDSLEEYRSKFPAYLDADFSS